MLLSRTPEGCLEVIGCVTSETTEDFTALVEMHPLKHMTLGKERESTPYQPMFCMLEGWSEEDRAMLLIQSVQLT